MKENKDINIAHKRQPDADEHTNGMIRKSVTTTFERTVPSTSDSIELKKGAKGTTWSIKCYGEAAEAYQRAKELYQQCQEEYGSELLGNDAE